MSLFFSLIGLSVLLFSVPVFSQELPISEEEMISVINSAYGKSPLYEGKDIPDKHLHSYDFNDDGISEWVVVPDNACGSTQNCTFFILQYDKKAKKPTWKLLLMGDGKISPLTPWGFATSPRKTKTYLDIVSVFDEGPASTGVRQLARHIYVWDGAKYVEYKLGTYPPEPSNDETKSFLQKLDQLKYQKNALKKKESAH